MKTLVLQSHRQPLPHVWLSDCLQSVKTWAVGNGYDYHFMDDELFDYLPEDLREKTRSQRVVATDLARLKALQAFLLSGYDAVIWCDADFLLFAPERWVWPAESYALGREVWIQAHETRGSQRLKAYVKVHNAFMVFCRGNAFLDFYTETAGRLLASHNGSMSPQFIGPKLLTAIHNIAQCPVLESMGMLSPLLVQDLIKGRGGALDLFRLRSKQPYAGVNLCSSMVEKGELTDQAMIAVIESLSNGSEII